MLKRLTVLTALILGSASAANLDLATNLDLMRGHLFASVSNYNAGSLQWGKKHAGHSLEELWSKMQPVVQPELVKPFEDALHKIMHAPGNTPPADYQETVEDFLEGPWDKAYDAAVAGADTNFYIALTSNLVTSSKGDYAAGMEGGNQSNPGEYQDAVGFLNRAVVEAAKISHDAMEGVEKLQIAQLSQISSDAYSKLADEVIASFQAVHSDPNAENLRLLGLGLTATNDEYIGEGEIGEGLESLEGAEKRWDLLKTTVEAKNAGLAASFAAHLKEMQAAITKDDQAAFKAALALAQAEFAEISKLF
ncbi:hypothetical protein [Deinococcus cellulosilyticus]|uniref:Uncharacterized protein n=1 Tax=Deinococcus cellulosilyticus (strain DSM 18568 / NBRC 106333 / KACC 11606 / 5516J-15) TaxID=1223518 RepID=A0A511N2C5_DEIC1|nr:hypothetical protein [Deinococcus cellulosilyticus]GEM46561.1 hypothetical protein DC3_21960 [Deinococcus cellulosilyticus NBRC 106333 = KACC 11606]